VAQRQNRQLGRNRERTIAARQVFRFEMVCSHGNPQSVLQGSLSDWVAGGEGSRAPPPAEPVIGRRESYMSKERDEAPRRCACIRSRCSATSRASSQSLQRTA